MIGIFDNKVDYDSKINIYRHCINSHLRLGWSDRDEPKKFTLNLHSQWSKEDCKSSSILSFFEECIENTDWFTTKNFVDAYVNYVTSDSIHYIHTHTDKNVALYYVNLDWQDGWYGETIFYDKNNTNEVVFTSSFTPGRIILFDGSVPHAIRPQSKIAPKYRLTISCLFN